MEDLGRRNNRKIHPEGQNEVKISLPSDWKFGCFARKLGARFQQRQIREWLPTWGLTRTLIN